MALNKSITPLASLKAEGTVTTPLATLVSSWAVVTALLVANAASLDPWAETVSLRLQLETTSDPTARETLAKQIAAYSNPDTALSLQIGARAAVLAAYPAVRTNSLALLTICIALVNGYITTAVADETAPYTTYALTYVPGSISAQYRALLAQLTLIQTNETNSLQGLPGVNQQLGGFYVGTHPLVRLLS